MDLRALSKTTEKFIADNSPAILTAVGVVGVVSTAYLTGKATFKAADIINDNEFRGGTAEIFKQRLKERASLVWKLYIPPVIVGTGTIVCVLGANRVGTRRAAALAAAYSISEKAFGEYKEKVIEKLGENQERKVRDELAQDRVDRSKDGQAEIVIVDGEVLCYDEFAGRYFKSNMEALKKAQNDTNYQILNECYASLSDFYNRLGLRTTSLSDEVGWSSSEKLELSISSVLSEDGRPCLAIDFQTIPIRDYYKVH